MMGDEDNMLYNMLLCCSISVDVEIMFVQHLLGKKCRPEQVDPQHFLSLEAGRSYSHYSASLDSSVDMWRES